MKVNQRLTSQQADTIRTTLKARGVNIARLTPEGLRQHGDILPPEFRNAPSFAVFEAIVKPALANLTGEQKALGGVDLSRASFGRTDYIRAARAQVDQLSDAERTLGSYATEVADLSTKAQQQATEVANRLGPEILPTLSQASLDRFKTLAGESQIPNLIVRGLETQTALTARVTRLEGQLNGLTPELTASVQRLSGQLARATETLQALSDPAVKRLLDSGYQTPKGLLSATLHLPATLEAKKALQRYPQYADFEALSSAVDSARQSVAAARNFAQAQGIDVATAVAGDNTESGAAASLADIFRKVGNRRSEIERELATAKAEVGALPDQVLAQAQKAAVEVLANSMDADVNERLKQQPAILQAVKTLKGTRAKVRYLSEMATTRLTPMMTEVAEKRRQLEQDIQRKSGSARFDDIPGDQFRKRFGSDPRARYVSQGLSSLRTASTINNYQSYSQGSLLSDYP